MSLMKWLMDKATLATLKGVSRLAAPRESSLPYAGGEDDRVLAPFLERCRAMPAPRVLELGTRRSIAGRSTMHKAWVPNAAEFLGTDIEAGEDVDIVADVHRLSTVTGEEQFDVVISCSSFEHFKYPHRAAHEVMKVLKIGGLLFIQTHQMYPIHAHPYDYFRFSREALAGLFGRQMGFEVIETDYEFPAVVYTTENPHLSRQPAFLNVRLFGEKLSRTPGDYVYEWDVQPEVKSPDA